MSPVNSYSSLMRDEVRTFEMSGKGVVLGSSCHECKAMLSGVCVFYVGGNRPSVKKMNDSLERLVWLFMLDGFAHLVSCYRPRLLAKYHAFWWIG